MFDDDDNLPKHKKQAQKDLSALSVSELNDYISDLKKEIERAERELGTKQNYTSEADSFFKS